MRKISFIIGIMIIFSTIVSASPTRSEYRELSVNIEKPVKRLAERFPNGVKHSLYVSQRYLKPMANDIKDTLKTFSNTHSGIDSRVFSQMQEVYSAIIAFEEARVAYEKEIGSFVNNTKKIGDSIGNEDFGGFVLGMISSGISKDSSDVYENRLRRKLNNLMDKMESLDNKLSYF